MSNFLRISLIKLAYNKPELREDILPILRENEKMAGEKTGGRKCPLAKNFEGLVGIGETFVNREVQSIRDEDYTIMAATGMTQAIATLERLREQVLKDPAGGRVDWLFQQLACNISDSLIDTGRARKDAKLKMDW